MSIFIKEKENEWGVGEGGEKKIDPPSPQTHTKN